MEKTTSQDRIKEMIRTLRITQSDIVEKTGLSKGAVSMYVNGKREPKQDGIAKISRAFGVDPAWLMGYDVPMTKEPPANQKRAEEIAELLMNLSDEEYNAIINLIKTLRRC